VVCKSSAGNKVVSQSDSDFRLWIRISIQVWPVFVQFLCSCLVRVQLYAKGSPHRKNFEQANKVFSVLRILMAIVLPKKFSCVQLKEFT